MKRTSYDRNGGPVDREGCGVSQTDKTDLCWSATFETGVLFIGRGLAYRKTGLHGILFISTVDLLQPHGLMSTSSSLHGLLFIQPPPCATPLATVKPPLHGHPPPSTVHPALHGVVLFIQPSTPKGPVHPETTPPLTVHPAPPTMLTVHPERQH